MKKDIIWESERLYARKMTMDDREDLCKILQDEEVMYAYEHAFSDAEVEEWIHRQLWRYEQYQQFGLWVIIKKDTEDLIGQCGLTLQPWKDKEVLEIGYLFQKAFWHQGYAIEAAQACKRYAFWVLHATEVYSIIRDTNFPSQRVAQRNGMIVCDHFIKRYYEMDMSHLVYRITLEEEKNRMIHAYWRATLSQNANAMRMYFHEEAMIRWLNTREQFTREEFIRANCEYPEKWDGEIEKIVYANEQIITAVHVFSLSSSASFHVTSFFHMKKGKILSLDEYWGDDGAIPLWRVEKHIGTRF